MNNAWDKITQILTILNEQTLKSVGIDQIKHAMGRQKSSPKKKIINKYLSSKLSKFEKNIANRSENKKYCWRVNETKILC